MQPLFLVYGDVMYGQAECTLAVACRGLYTRRTPTRLLPFHSGVLTKDMLMVHSLLNTLDMTPTQRHIDTTDHCHGESWRLRIRIRVQPPHQVGELVWVKPVHG